jgi:signal transduction histidine kinase
LLDHAARAKTVKLDCNVRPDLPPVRADYNRILQVLGNLLDNAVKFSAAGGEVWLRAEADGGVVRFSVADTGPGIASEELPHVMTRRPVQRKVRRRLRSRVSSSA